MTRMLLIRLAALLVACACAPEKQATDDVAQFAARAKMGILLEMRDGVRLSTDLYFPDGTGGRLPVVLWRTAYGKKGAYDNEALFPFLVSHGYVVVAQDVRGRGESEGVYEPTIGDRSDGYDTVSWLTSQEWSNGKLGTTGCSLLGEAQLLLAATRHPNHTTVVPQSAASGYHIRGRPWAAFDGGAFELGQTAGFFSGDGVGVDYSVLPIIDVLKQANRPPSAYETFASTNPEGPYFMSREWIRLGDKLDVPALFFDSWYDYGPADTLALFNVLQKESVSETARDNQFVVIAPGTHCSYLNPEEDRIVGERDLGDARIDVLNLQLRWYDHWLKGIDNGVTDRPKVQYYLMGKNVWQTAEAWPVPGTRFEKLYLSSLGKANGLSGDGVLSFDQPAGAAGDRFRYDPASPVPTLGGHACCMGLVTEAGAYDQSQIEQRDDVLVYTTAALDAGLEVTGPLEVILYVSSSAPDTDFTAKLVDVYPDGRAFNVRDGVLRMRPGEIYRARLDLHVTSNYFGPGHRIRLEVSSSNFPRWDRNLNTGGNNYDETEFVVAENTVHHSAEYPSYLLLPIVD